MRVAARLSGATTRARPIARVRHPRGGGADSAAPGLHRVEARRAAMKMTLDMPNVSACDASQCAYNANGTCHARAITIGDGLHAACDTFLVADRIKDPSRAAGVGACKISACRHNTDYECEARSIRLAAHGDHVDCETLALK
jgi:hypothetical protein